MPDERLNIGDRGFTAQLAELVRDARTLIGWSQRELAERADTSQPTVSRLEHDRSTHLDLVVARRLLAELGIRARLDVDAHHLADRRRQHDGVHAILNGYGARRLEALGWRIATEVRIGDGAPRGWIDLLAFREADRSLLVDETKTELRDIGGLQRSLAFYEREAWEVARRLGWRPARTKVLVLGLDSGAIGRQILDTHDLIGRAFPASVPEMLGWLADPARRPPGGWCLALADPRARRDAWLRETPLTSRRRVHPFADYADAAAQLLGR